ncbi:MAG: fatty acid-binding protein DegV, partial [Clostridium sp.]|nr:fatty acid-binding protein DegV [Clostridium sp.]
EQDAKNFIETIKDLPGILSLKSGQISPALGVHTGKGLIGLCIEKVSS